MAEPEIRPDEIALRSDATVQIGMSAIQAGVDQSDADTAPGRESMRSADRHALVPRLQPGAGVVDGLRVAGGRGGLQLIGVQGLDQRDARIRLQLRQQLLARGAFRNRKHGAVHAQQCDGPGRYMLQAVLGCQ